MKVTRHEMKEELLEIDVEVEVKEVKEAYDEAYKSIAHEVTIPGFRKGKAPRRLLEARISPDLLNEEATKYMTPKVYSYAIEELDLRVLKEPDIEGELEPGKESTYTIKVEVAPNVELGPYTDLKIEIKRQQVTEEDIEEQISFLREKHATLKETDRDVVELGDYAILNIDGYDEGELVPDLSQSDLAIEIGSNTIYKGLEEACIGLRVGEETSQDLSFSADNENESIAGKTIEFKVTIKDLKEKVLPPLDDDFPKNYLRKDILSLDSLKEQLQRELEENIMEQEKNEFNRRLLNTIAQSSKYTIYDEAVESELKHIVSETIKILRQQGNRIDEKDETTMDNLRRQYHHLAVTNVTDSLLLNAVIKKEGIKVETEELDTRIAKLARENKMEKKLYRRKIFKENKLDSVKQTILREKAMSFLQENNYILYTAEEKEENKEIDV